MHLSRPGLAALGTLSAALLLTGASLAELPPTPPSDTSVDVVVSEGFCEEGFFPVSCSAGFESVDFVTVTNIPGNFCDGPDFTSDEGITCQIDEGGNVSWSFDPDNANSNVEAIVPAAIQSVILSTCYASGSPGVGYTYLYGPLGVSADDNLKLFAPIDGYLQVRPSDVRFCYKDPDIFEPTGLASTPPIPTCDSSACPTEPIASFLVEVSRLRDADGDILQPEAALDEETCVCSPSDEPLEQCDPAAGEGSPNACRDGTAGGPGQVTRLDQWNGDPYFCRTVNGTRRCWAY